ncbi:MAG: hypothetical protein A2Y62_14350 [Candidatus Fischerbacteria bacterium RBG_13_37_8]|uniref:cysteine desulfurase n=1 Tax=Candidatus Fischerbacteria bacterium RBG_13_37_8 TaxID=1817863 RepID=A0A1F5VNM2_9BACT|nr:MAG: hypothetical protein A2Y62_14350 [Candidatus Fischerbacteria bacterium RBG_13_37_8]
MYLDNNATTPLDDNVRKMMMQAMRYDGNPSSIHMLGGQSRDIVEWAREQTAAVINAEPDEIIFTSSGTEANNAVIKAIVRLKGKGHFITASIEHSSVLQVFKIMESMGCEVSYLSVDRKGIINIEELKRQIRPDTLLISIMHVNNETGSIQPIADIAALAKEKNILFHSDIVQSFGKFTIDVRTLPVDYLTFSAHKIYGPKGIGGLYIRKGKPFIPLIEGGHQENGLRAGTEALVNIAGMGKACEEMMHLNKDDLRQHLKTMKRALYEIFKQEFPDVRVNGDLEHGSPTTLNLMMPSVNNRELLAYLDFFKISASTGSACISGSTEPSHVLTAMGLSAEETNCSFRMGMGKFNDMHEVNKLRKVLRYFKTERAEFFDYIFPADLSSSQTQDSQTILVDLRTRNQRKLHPPLPGAVCVNISMKALKQLPRDKEIILMCEDGYLANVYALRLKKAGWQKVKALFGGYRSWRMGSRE